MARTCRLVQRRDSIHGRTYGAAPSRHNLVVAIISRRLRAVEGVAVEVDPCDERSMGDPREVVTWKHVDPDNEFRGFGPGFDEAKIRALSMRIDNCVAELTANEPANELHMGLHYVSNSNPHVEQTVAQSQPASRPLELIQNRRDPNMRADIVDADGEERDSEEIVREQVRMYRMESKAAADQQRAADVDAEALKKSYFKMQLKGASRKKEVRKVKRKLLKMLRATEIEGVVNILKGTKVGISQVEKAWKVAMMSLHPDRKVDASSHDKAITTELISLKNRLSELK